MNNMPLETRLQLTPFVGRKHQLSTAERRLQKTILAGLLVLAAGLLYSQPLNFAWAKQIGGTMAQFPDAIITDSRQNIYLSGTFDGTCDMDPGPGTDILTCTGYDDSFLSKFDGFGNHLWSKRWDTWGGCPEFLGMAVDTNFNLYLTGHFSATCDFDLDSIGNTTLTGAGIWDIFVLKLDSSGNFLWVKGMGSADYDVGNSIVVDNTGNAYVTGYFTGTVDFNPGAGVFNLSSSTSASTFILKLDSNGNFVWAKKLGGSGQSRGYGIGFDSLGNVVSTGYFAGTADFDPGTGTYSMTALGARDVYVSKLSSAGNFAWARRIGGTGNGVSMDLAIDHASNLFLGGHFTGVMDFDPGAAVYNLSSTTGAEDAFTCKLDYSGNFIWAKRFGGSQDTWGHKIAVDSAGNSFTMGFFDYAADFDPGPGNFNITTFGGTDIFCVNLDAAGNLIYPYHYGGTLDDRQSDVTVSSLGNVYSSGLFQGTLDIDPSPIQFDLTSLGGADIYLQKLSTCTPTSSYLSHTACNSYVYDGYTYTESEVIIKTLSNSVGCDSIVTLDLSIGGADSTLNIIACDSFSLNSQTYNVSGTFTQTLTDHVGCDSILTLNLSLSASSAYTYAVTACDTYSANGQTYILPGTYTQTLSNAAGCDSVLTIQLSLIHSTDSIFYAHGCNTYSFNGQTYTQPGIYTQTLVNAAGCDSILTLNLTLDLANYAVTQSGNTLTSLQPSATYQWIDCNNAFAPIPGAISQNFTPIVTGSYAVIVINGTCSDTSSCITLTIVGIPDLQAQGITVSPNPVHDVLNIDFHLSSQEAVAATLITASGIKVFEVLDPEVLAMGDHTFSVSLEEIPSGMYYLQFRRGDGIKTVKVLVQH